VFATSKDHERYPVLIMQGNADKYIVMPMKCDETYRVEKDGIDLGKARKEREKQERETERPQRLARTEAIRKELEAEGILEAKTEIDNEDDEDNEEESDDDWDDESDEDEDDEDEDDDPVAFKINLIRCEQGQFR